MKIGIVIPVINLWNQYTKAAIDSIKTKYDYRIVLVDNASTDETCVEAGKLVSDKFMHRRNEINAGVQASWNFGINDSFEHGCDYVLVLNNDILLHPEAIDRLVERFESGNPPKLDLPDKELTGQELLDFVSGELESFLNAEDKIVMVTCTNVRGEIDPKDLNNINMAAREAIGEAESPDFAGFMINKRCWELVGEFDEGFYPAYFEDNDYHYRIKLLGLKAITLPPAVFYHFGSRTQNQVSSGLVPGIKFEANRQYYIKKWGATPGEEEFTSPFDKSENTIRWTKQSPL